MECEVNLAITCSPIQPNHEWGIVKNCEFHRSFNNIHNRSAPPEMRLPGCSLRRILIVLCLEFSDRAFVFRARIDTSLTASGNGIVQNFMRMI